MAACEPCPAPINVNAKMTSSKRCSRSSSKASCRGQNQQQECCEQANQSQKEMPNYMKPLSRTPSYSARINIGGGECCPGHPRADCCRVPCPLPNMPKCPLGIYAERAQSLKPNRVYVPPENKFEGLSTYRQEFFLKCGEKPKSFKPAKTFVPSDAKLEGISTYREAYHCKPMEPKKKPTWSMKGTFEPSGAPMEGISQYRFDYKGCMAPRQPSFKPEKTFVPSDAKLEGITTYRVNYIPYCPREYEYAKAKQTMKESGGPSCGPMEGVSTYRMDYYPKCAVKVNSLKPTIKARFSDAKMAGITTYKNDFIPFHFDKCPPPNCIPAELYKELYPDPCLFQCGGDGDKAPAKDDDECPNVCPPDSTCCAAKNGGVVDAGGGGFASGCCDKPFPYTIGNAGEQIRSCCDALDDPPIEKIEQDC